MEETQQKTTKMATTEEQQTKQSVQDTQMLATSPPHDTSTPAKTIIVKDVPDSSSQNINPLNVEDLKKILDQSTLQARLCENPILVSVEELQKAVADITRDKVNTQEPRSTIPLATSAQTLVQTLDDTSTKVDTTVKVDIVDTSQTTKVKELTKEQAGQIDVFVPNAQTQGAPQLIIKEDLMKTRTYQRRRSKKPYKHW